MSLCAQVCWASPGPGPVQRGPHSSDTAAAFPRAPPRPPFLTPLIGPHLVIADLFPLPPRSGARLCLPGRQPVRAVHLFTGKCLSPLQESGPAPANLLPCEPVPKSQSSCTPKSIHVPWLTYVGSHRAYTPHLSEQILESHSAGRNHLTPHPGS